MFAIRVYTLYLDDVIPTWKAYSVLQISSTLPPNNTILLSISKSINPRVLPKDKILFLISKFNFITEKKQIEIHKGNF